MPHARIDYLINSLNSKLQRDDDWVVTLVVRNWHVSFVRAYFRPDDMMVDITFNNGFAVENSAMLRHLFVIQPEAAKFCLFMKKWLKMNKVNMKNYNVVLLVIFYLQQKNFFPTIQNVQNGLVEKFIDGKCSNFSKISFLILCIILGHEVQFSDRRNLPDYRVRKLRNFRDDSLIMGFFDFYRQLDYDSGIISPYSGRIERL